MRAFLTCAITAAMLLTSACAKSGSSQQSAPAQQNSEAPQSSVQQASVQTQQGKVTMGQGAVDPNSLGLPLYPGAQPSDAGSFAVTNQQGGTQIVTMVTKDGYDKVVAFYKAKMPAGTQEVVSGEGAAAKAQFVEVKAHDKVQRSVIVAPAGDSVNITMIVGSSQ